MAESPFFTVSLSAVLFYPQVQLENTLSLAQQFVVATGGLFEPNPTILPQQPNLPPEVPFLIFRSNPEAYQCEISRARVSFHYQDRQNRREAFDACLSRCARASMRCCRRWRRGSRASRTGSASWSNCWP
ncbi:MAG: hypothetical protein V2A74_08610, partial [bacterium]